MRLGSQLFGDTSTPESWVNEVRKGGYRSAVCPDLTDAPEDVVRAYVRAAEASDITISEVGAWSNPISPDEAVRQEALDRCKRQLALADTVGARCCVNIAGSRGEQWDGPHPDNFTDDTFALIVDTVREIIDAVSPKRTFFALETMPWIFPDSADTYVALLKAIDRRAFAVHFDPVNIISSPRTFYRNGDMIRDFFAKLGPHIRNCHAKDIKLAGKLTVHLDEVVPGRGGLDYRTFLRELNKLDPDTSLIVEHLHAPEEGEEAARYIRSVARELDISL
ncbi:sugar phosphate isomerase/epimerase family protein [Cohnella rhizosphaerae]|uniref:Sugar phosphate isomerase/epimerase n=1 Tax=Cohnella rhizosphaerae TaxID=1457232 RepID=A0A9X4KXX5_9BACL|nr:sugar phosphate isomerase/epimerase family protein [Cohnella rhizosphaerae]MDG0812401.1 sugar phosphate isomerase/epimerase [Cohnella rhizosphaerae]